MDTFKPSIDWGAEAVKSAVWILPTSAISAACVLLIGVVLVRFTTFGRRYWTITGGYFTGKASLPAWGLLAVMMLSVIGSVRIDVLLSYYHNDLYSALQIAVQGVATKHETERNSGIHGFYFALAIFALLAAVNVARIVFDTWLTQMFVIRWRVWLTARLTGRWLDRRGYYRASTIPTNASSRTSTSSPRAWERVRTSRPITPGACWCSVRWNRSCRSCPSR